MTCQSCGVRFSKSKADAFEHEDEAWCSEVCASDAGWVGHATTRSLTQMIVDALGDLLKRMPPSCPLTPREQRFLDHALAIVSFESGAQRKAGPPATLPLLAGALREFERQRWPSGWGLLLQLLWTIRALRSRAWAAQCQRVLTATA